MQAEGFTVGGLQQFPLAIQRSVSDGDRDKLLGQPYQRQGQSAPLPTSYKRLPGVFKPDYSNEGLQRPIVN